ncbi:MAG: DUF3016 domain-containing protein [Betaproteobacteria bacterium]|nr:DUF3016 domain-containing protein [Betaproteobacteria bacterium]
MNFIESERYTDVGNTAVARERALNTLDEHLRQLAARLPDGQTLRVEVLDIDLAGAQLSISANAPRVMRGGRGDWPQVRLRWWLLEGGRVLRNGEDHLLDLNYLAPSQTSKALAGELPHEKRMLDRWFAETFSSARQ